MSPGASTHGGVPAVCPILALWAALGVPAWPLGQGGAQLWGQANRGHP